MENFQSLVSIAPWTFIAQICNLLIQAVLIKKFLFKPVQNILKKRQDEVDQLYASASEAETTANEAKQNYEALLSSAKEEASTMIKEASATAQRRGDSILSDAKSEAAMIREKAQIEIAVEKKKAFEEVKGEISGLALGIAEKIVGKEIQNKDQDALISEFIDKLGEEK